MGSGHYSTVQSEAVSFSKNQWARSCTSADQTSFFFPFFSPLTSSELRQALEQSLMRVMSGPAEVERHDALASLPHALLI
jgi:hypothetical protein